MCGISGIFDISLRREIPKNILEKMSLELTHRGRDGHGYYFSDGVALAHRRLAIIAPQSGHQPMITHDGNFVIVFNGMIYNYQMLRQKLIAAGHNIDTNSDTQTLLYAYLAYGRDVCKYLDGFYSFAIYDKVNHTLFASSDRFGKKPFYYHICDNGFFYFASELPSLVHGLKLADIKRPISARAIDNYFTFGFIPAPKTIFDGIAKLPPASNIFINMDVNIDSHQQIYKYPTNDIVNISKIDAQSNIKDLLVKSLEKRLISDVNIGLLLSSGTDSGVIAALLADMKYDNIECFTASFAQKNYDEADNASMLAKYLKLPHKILNIDLPQEDIIDDMALIAGEPFADASIIPTYMICSMASKHVSVLLGGDGADEIFFGYARYKSFYNQEKIKSLLSLATRQKLFGNLARTYPQHNQIPKYLRFGASLEAFVSDKAGGYLRNFAIMRDIDREKIYNADFKLLLKQSDAKSLVEEYFIDSQKYSNNLLKQAQYVDLNLWLPARMLVKSDRASMAAHSELRSPFLDYDLADYCFGLPIEFFDNNKEILKNITKNLVPPNYFNRPKKGFVFPLAQIMRTKWANRLEMVCNEGNIASMNILDMVTIRTMMREHFSGKYDHSRFLWALLQLDAFFNIM